jgi:hypothetical protein
MSELDRLDVMARTQCVDIFRDYEESEVMKYAPPSVQKAWDIGKQLVSLEKELNKKKMKGFTL